MDIKDFVRDVLVDLDAAVVEAGQQTARDVKLVSGGPDNQTVQFDLAVTVEGVNSTSGKAGVKVFELLEGGGETSKTSTNATVTRIKFGVNFDTDTREAAALKKANVREQNEARRNKNSRSF